MITETELKQLKEDLKAATDEVARLKGEIGVPPEGSHPDEVHPRAETWHRERQNGLTEIQHLRQYIATVEAEVKRLRDWVMSVSNSVNIDPEHAPAVLLMISNEAAELLAASALK